VCAAVIGPVATGRHNFLHRIDALCAENNAAREALSALSSYVGNGLGEDTTVADYEARIRDGIDRVVRVETARREQAEAERDALAADNARLRSILVADGLDQDSRYSGTPSAPRLE
jgi:hypothetical protein